MADLGRRILVHGIAVLAPLAAPTGTPAQNQILELDGTGAHVELPVAAFENLREATVEAWVRWDDWGYFSQWFAYGTDEMPWRALGLNHYSLSPILQFFIYPGTPGDLRVIGVEASLPLGKWYHMAAVSGSGGMRFYLDGTLMGSGTYPGSFADLGQGARGFLGRSTWQTNAPFRGALDEVRLWSVARGVEEIRADMVRVLRGDEPGLAGLWSFDAGDARDGSTGGHDGVLRDGARCGPAPYPGAKPRLWPALVRGEVRDESGAPVIDARVRLRGWDGSRVEAGSGPSGDFSVAVLDTGLYTVELISELTRMPRREVHVVPGADLLLDLRPLPPNLVARWLAEGDARDGVGEHHGDLSGDMAFAPGVVGQAFQFDGEGDGVRVPNAPALNPQGSISLVAWVFPEADEAMTVLAMWGDHAEWAAQRTYSLAVQAGRRLSFHTADALHQEDAAYHHLHTRPNVVPLHAWTQVVAVWDATSGERRLYANGLLVGRRADTPGSIARSLADLAIGINLQSPKILSAPFTGRIDEVALYGVALAEDGIARLYSAHAQAQWPAEGNANDATRSGHDGVAVGDVSFAPGVVGQAFVFDGRDGYVEFDPRIGNYGAEDFSVELWLRPGFARDGTRPILVKGDGSADGLSLSLDGAGHVAAALAGRQDSLKLASGRPLSPEVWHHVALVREGPMAHLYLDGELDGSAAADGIVELQTPDPLLLGGLPQSPSYAGQIDEIALHRRPLSAEEIRATHDRVEAAWRWRVWHTRLQTWGSVSVGLLALAIGGRYVSQLRARRRERKQLAEARRARQAADAANEAKSAFLANMSHEIRTPMNAIMGHAQVLRDESSLDEEQQRRSVAAICDHGGLLLGLVDDILDLSKSEAGRMELQPVDFDLGEVIDSLQVLFEMRCRQRGLQLRVEREGEAGGVRGDESKLRQVLVNLLGNAVKFTDEGEVVLRVANRGGEYSFEVCDTGPGIAPGQQEAMFEPFRQGSSGMARGGTGLGLSISQRHAALMGGHLEVAPSPGGGACFSFCIPLERSEPAAARTASTRDLAVFGGLALPPALRSRLRRAAQMHNVTEVKRCLEDMQRLGEHEARLADALTGAVNRFDLAPVTEALEVTVDG